VPDAEGGHPDAGSGEQCLRVDPPELDLEAGAPGTVTVAEVVVESCGAEPAALTAVRLVDGGSPAFSVAAVPEGLSRACLRRRDRACAGRAEVPPRGRAVVVVRYAPRDGGAHGGRLRLETDVPGAGRIDVPLYGAGVVDAPSDCLAEARIAGHADWSSYSDVSYPLHAPPLETVELRAVRPPPGAEVAYRWRVLERPDESRVRVAPRPEAPRVTVFLDLAGAYVFGLSVTDPTGQRTTCRVHVEAGCCGAGEATIQLVWETPQRGADADLDLHLRREPAGWFCEPGDCHPGNPEPGWGASHDAAAGHGPLPGGPENVRLAQMEEGVVYRIGVHSAASRSARLATVRVFVAGVLRHEVQERLREGAFWEVADLHGQDGRVVPVGRLHAEPPEPSCR